MENNGISYLKDRLRSVERERERLLREISALQNRTQPEKTSSSVGSRLKGFDPVDEEKVSLFLRLFSGRKDVFAKFWESKKSGKKGWSPVCRNEWAPGICEKPKVKCAECPHQSFEPFGAGVVRRHLRGEITAGVYAIRKDSDCGFLAVDFDNEEWQRDMALFKEEGEKLGVDIALERSRSGNGGHAWIFFSEPIPATLARRLGSIIMTQALKRSSQLKLSSYDRFFPNQDFIPGGGFGNLIALPLQKVPRERGNTVFVDKNIQPIGDQWACLSAVHRLSYGEVSRMIDKYSPSPETSKESGDVEEDKNRLWNENSLDVLLNNKKDQFAGVKVEGELFSQIKINTENLPSRLVLSLKRKAVFANPEFFRKQKMRFSTWNTPRYIFCGEQTQKALILPGGLVDSCKEICEAAGARFFLKDKRLSYGKIRIAFKGRLEKEQKKAFDALLPYERGVLTAPPGAGKTVIACAFLSNRKRPALILVHRAPLCDQWREKLAEFTSFPKERIGLITGQKKTAGGKVDIAMIQTVGKMKNPVDFLSRYGQIIIDECHHIPAFTFEAVTKKAPVVYILGLTATPYRKDGLQPIIYMQCGPVRYKMTEKRSAFSAKRVIIRSSRLKAPEGMEPCPPIHKIWDLLVYDKQRLDLIAGDLKENLNEGRVPLLISDRREHLQLLKTALEGKNADRSCIFILDGGLSKKRRIEILDEISSRLSRKRSVCLLATGALVGEGFDLPALDTLFLTLPVAFSGRLVQYAGRLNRPLEGKKEIRIYDYVDTGSGLTASMFKKRVKVYRQMGYRIESDLTVNLSEDPFQSQLFSDSKFLSQTVSSDFPENSV